MSLNFTLNSPKELVVREAITRTVNSLSIERIIDIPLERKIIVHIEELGRVTLDSLSDDNYNNPPWTDELVIEAIKAKLQLQ